MAFGRISLHCFSLVESNWNEHCGSELFLVGFLVILKKCFWMDLGWFFGDFQDYWFLKDFMGSVRNIGKDFSGFSGWFAWDFLLQLRRISCGFLRTFRYLKIFKDLSGLFPSFWVIFQDLEGFFPLFGIPGGSWWTFKKKWILVWIFGLFRIFCRHYFHNCLFTCVSFNETILLHRCCVVAPSASHFRDR